MPKDKVLSTKTFILSNLTILILAAAVFGGIYYMVYPERFAANIQKYNPVTKEPVSLFLKITSPEDDILVNDPNLVISGNSTPGATIIISNNQTDVGLETGKNGEFSRVFPLNPGANIVEINAYDAEGNVKTVTKSVYFTEEKIE